MRTILQTKNLKKVYRTKESIFQALDNIELTVREGEFVGIMGPSGSGKTTLLHLFATIDEPTSGEIEIAGTDIMQLNEDQRSSFRRKQLGFIFQDYNLLDTLTVKENILLPLVLEKMKVAEMEQSVNEIASRFGIQSILDKYPYQISGGQKQRTAASRAMIARPSLLLADEPTGALDSKSATDLLESLKNVNETDKVTILMVTHDAFAASYCKRVIFIKDGKTFTELVRGNHSRKDFFQKVINVLPVLGGNIDDTL
ncbi:ABC transporter ATP-binding protein [Shimazuella kribbensis]|uniref:ABC transporter ATP-binding protein n=1 Tax=Shimazuella kribbensis TaxID=139808 RepID=UPI0003F6BC9F|nr:ABC transporter ATP-binding protein [Shimazuella kribbensis]